MAFPYKQVLMVGATAGIGAAMADRLVLAGAGKVVVVGRRQDRLDAFVKRHGEDKAGAIRFDLADRQSIDSFVSRVTTSYPDLDCVFLNAGVQSVVNFKDPEKVDLAAFHSEMSINFGAFVDLSLKFLPFLMSKQSETSLI
jgi:NADP-dependent 3-hydroxy acid dehydrogenase YdfG